MDNDLQDDRSLFLLTGNQTDPSLAHRSGLGDDPSELECYFKNEDHMIFSVPSSSEFSSLK